MTEKRFKMIITSADGSFYYLDEITGEKITSTLELENKLNELHDENQKLKKENEQLKQQINDMSRFEHTGEHIRLSINIETGELQRHIYATGQWFGDFDRVLCENWINKEDYQRFIDRVIEVYNTEFKKELQE